MAEFVPKYLGFNHLTRQDFIQKYTRPMAKKLFNAEGDTAIVVIDGTYIYIQKSAGCSFQRRTYSMHKRRPLVKPMLIVSTTGYVLEVLGPFYADGRNNDASIFNSHLIKSADSLHEWLNEEDIIVIDRGFRDSIGLIEDMKLIPKMPHFLQHGEAQHSTEEANESRLVTSIRWVIESVNGLIKTFKLLSNVMLNSQISYIGDYVRIVCSMCNAYGPPRVQNADEVILAERMLTLTTSKNELKEKVEREGWARKRVAW